MRGLMFYVVYLAVTAGCDSVVVEGDVDAAPAPSIDATPAIDAIPVPIPVDHTLFVPYSEAANDISTCSTDTGFGLDQLTNRHGVVLTDSCFFPQTVGEERHDAFANARLGAEATIAAWIQPSFPGSNAFAVGEEGYPALSRSQNNGRMAMIVRHNGTLFEAIDTVALPNLEWIFYVGVMEFKGAAGTEIRLYRNASLISTTMVPGLIHTNENCGFSVGGHNQNGPPCDSSGFQGFKGTFDDIRVYDRVLSTAEITALFNEPAP